MKIRSITVFCQPGFPVNRLLLQKVGIFANHAKKIFEAAGFEVQSLRLATPPFEQYLAPIDLPAAAEQYAIEAHAEGFDYISLGPIQAESKDWQVIPEALRRSGRIFLSGQLTTSNGEICLEAARNCAKTIKALANLEPNGFANLRFCALANVPAFTPFFPAAYGKAGAPVFALAIEAADLALETFTEAPTLAEAASRLISRTEETAARLEAAASRASQIYGYEFKGLDFTLAPFPKDAQSICLALEALGLQAFGSAGSLFASAFLTSTLDQARYTRTGFNGLMLPVLEDSGLARRAAEGSLSVQDLLLFSSVCGAGLDVIPIPGDTEVEELTPVLLDLAALSLRLGKALTARLMPIPNKAAGDGTAFDFAFFANSRVMPLRSAPIHGKLSGNENVPIAQRRKSV
jgi:hypothetical protein